MGIQPHHRSWATFYCEDCDDVFADVLPAIHEELPKCHVCQCATRIWGVLSYGCGEHPNRPPQEPQVVTPERKRGLKGFVGTVGFTAMSMLVHPGVRLDQALHLVMVVMR